MLLQIYTLSTLSLIALTVAVPLSFESFNEVDALNFDQIKNIPENVVEEKKKYYEDKIKDVEKSNTQEVLDSFVENSKEKESKRPEKNKVDKHEDRFSEESKEIEEEYKDKEESKNKEKVEEKADFEVFLGSFAENSEVKDSPNKYDEVDKDHFQGKSEEKNKVNKDKERYKEKDEEKSDFEAVWGSFAENSEVKDSKERYDEIDNDRFQGVSEEKNNVYEHQDIGKQKEKDKEKPDFQVFWDSFSKKSKRKKSKKEKKEKKEKKKKDKKHLSRFNSPGYGTEYSYYVIDVDFKKDKVKVYPDRMFDDYSLGLWPRSSYGFPSVFDYLMAPYYPPRPYWPFKFQPMYRRPKVVHKKRRILL